MQNDILIAYYSWSGNTKKIAEYIQQRTGGKLFEILPLQPYSNNYSEVTTLAKAEIRSGVFPELVSTPDDSSYQTLFIGTPNWWSTMAPPVASFLQNSNLKGKLVLPFATHGGGGAGAIGRNIAQLCTGASVAELFSTYNDGGSSMHSEIDLWLKKD